MNSNEERTCCYCGKAEADMGPFKAKCPDGDLICAGFCQIGLEVDAAEE